MIHIPQCENYDITSIRTSSASHLHWKDLSNKKPLSFRIYANFEADNEIDKSSIGNETTNTCKQNPVLNGYQVISELEIDLKGGYYESLLGYHNID